MAARLVLPSFSGGSAVVSFVVGERVGETVDCCNVGVSVVCSLVGNGTVKAMSTM